MSLAVLVRKSKQYTDRVSGCGHAGFSLNGGYRNQGWVGQDLLGRTIIRTPFRGVDPIGHGGKNGTYVTTVLAGGSPCTNDPAIVKRSNMNTPGYISSRLTPRGAPCSLVTATRCAPIWVQKFDPDDHAQSQYIKRVRALAVGAMWPVAPAEYVVGSGRCKRKPEHVEDGAIGSGSSSRLADPYLSTSGKSSCTSKCGAASYFIGGKKYYMRNMGYTKSLPVLPMSSGEYTLTRYLIVNHLPTPPCAAPWPPPMARDAQCKTAVVTAEEGYRLGLLPPEWNNGGRSDVREWAKSMFGAPDVAPGPPPHPPPPPPRPHDLPQQKRVHTSQIGYCDRSYATASNNWYYKPGSEPRAPVGASCNPGVIGAKARRLGGSRVPRPTVIFRKPPKPGRR